MRKYCSPSDHRREFWPARSAGWEEDGEEGTAEEGEEKRETGGEEERQNGREGKRRKEGRKGKGGGKLTSKLI